MIKHDLIKSIINNKIAISLLLFLGSYLISILTNLEYAPIDNMKKLLYMLVFVLLFVVFVNEQDVEQKRKEITFFSSILLITTFVLSAVSLFTYYFGIDMWYYLDEASAEFDSFFVIGTYGGDYLYGLYNPNTCGAISSISILSSMQLLLIESKYKKSRKGIRVLLFIFIALNVIVQYFALILSGSRGSFYSLIFVLGLLLFIGIVKSKIVKNSYLKVFVAIGLSVLLLSGLVLVSSPLIKVSKSIKGVASESITEKTFIEKDFEKEIVKLTENHSVFTTSGQIGSFFDSYDVSLGRDKSLLNNSGRTSLWKTGFEIFLESPIFGSTKQGMTEKFINSDVIDSKVALQGGIHNIYITILASSGIVGFVFYAIAICIAMLTFFKVLFKKEHLSSYLLTSFGITLFYLISELVEQRTVYTASIFTVTFWVYFGYMYYFAKLELSEE